MAHVIAVLVTTPEGWLAIIGLVALCCLVGMIFRDVRSRQFKQHSRPTVCLAPHVPPFSVPIE